jgi:hypothetical protein
MKTSRTALAICAASSGSPWRTWMLKTRLSLPMTTEIRAWMARAACSTRSSSLAPRGGPTRRSSCWNEYLSTTLRASALLLSTRTCVLKYSVLLHKLPEPRSTTLSPWSPSTLGAVGSRITVACAM